MPWIEFEREDAFEGSDQPFISITPGEEVFFSAVFCRLAGLGPDKKVTIYIETDDRKLGFEFGVKGRYALCQAGRSNKGNMPVAMSCSCAGLVRKLPWVEAVAHLPNRKDRRFAPKKEANKWVIQLCPAFEERTPESQRRYPLMPSEFTDILERVARSYTLGAAISETGLLRPKEGAGISIQ